MLVDTSGLVCYFDHQDPRHQDAVTLFHTAPIRLTHSYVLAEFIPLCQVRRLNRGETLTFVSELIDNPEVRVVWVDDSLHRAAVELLISRPDKTYSLCDAVSFLLMRGHGIIEAHTTDRHFEQEGFVRLLKAS